MEFPSLFLRTANHLAVVSLLNLFLPPTQFIRVANSCPEGKESGVVKGKCIVSGAWAESVIALINLRVQTCIT